MLGNSNSAPVGENPLSVHNFILQNRLYNNISKYTGKTHTDGNGIIIDLHGGYPGAPVVAGVKYPARTLIENNVVYSNGVRGIHIYKSSNVLVRNNTCYQNLVDATYTNEGELSAVYAKDILFVNNVAYVDGTNRALTSYLNLENVVFRSNSYGNGAVVLGTGTTSTGNVSGVTPASFYSPTTFDFRNRVLPDYTISAQKIIDVGSSVTNSVANNNDYSAYDFYYVTRPAGAQVDRGAFETSVTTGPKASTASGSGG